MIPHPAKRRCDNRDIYCFHLPLQRNIHFAITLENRYQWITTVLHTSVMLFDLFFYFPQKSQPLNHQIEVIQKYNESNQ